MAFTHRQTRVGTRVTSYTRTDERQRLRSPELRVGKDGRAAGTMPMPMAQFPFRGEMIRIMGYRRRGREHFLCLPLSLSLSLSLSPPPATTSSWSAPLPRHAASPPLWLLYPRGKMAAAAEDEERGSPLPPAAAAAAAARVFLFASLSPFVNHIL